MNNPVTCCLICFATLLINGMLQTADAAEPKSAHSQREIRIITNSINMKLALIPEGKFVMGSPRDEKEREFEEIPHEVVISQSFYMGVYEVTQREFSKITLPGENRRPPKAIFNSSRGGGPNHPIENLLWKDAIDFCKTLSKQTAERQAGRTYRLPTEAEWEYACRAGSQTAFHFGNLLTSKQANFNGNYPYGSGSEGPYLRKTAQVGSYEPNAFGLYDMHGNVAEYCADWYDPEYYRDSPIDNPLGPPVGVLPTGYGNYYMMVRGGCWVDDARACRSAYRFRAMPRNTYRLIGFRVVCEVNKKD